MFYCESKVLSLTLITRIDPKCGDKTEPQLPLARQKKFRLRKNKMSSALPNKCAQTSQITTSLTCARIIASYSCFPKILTHRTDYCTTTVLLKEKNKFINNFTKPRKEGKVLIIMKHGPNMKEKIKLIM